MNTEKQEIRMIYAFIRSGFENRGYLSRFSPTEDLFEYDGKTIKKFYAIGNRASYSKGDIFLTFEI